MIFVTGDCHGDYRRFNMENFPEQKKLTKSDYVIIAGDFGYWTPSKEQDYWLDWLNKKSFVTLFIDGNHESFDDLEKLPNKRWNGDTVDVVADSILHLRRGSVFNIGGCKIFTFGGARSHDIDGGILDRTDPEFKIKKKVLDRSGLPYRINHETWWEQEMPTGLQMFYGELQLSRNDTKVDYIITHCCSSSTQAQLSNGFYNPDALTDYFEKLKSIVDYKKWFFGHYHDNRTINEKEILLYEKIIRIW
ncbi:MAG: hypothetical protein [Bacteriophage sp.]|nr:MAG: hypothetical protein [Bacteriophage sp.]